MGSAAIAAQAEPSPWRTVTTKPSPRKIMTASAVTVSLLGSYTTGLRTMNSESSYTSGLGR